MKVEEQQAIGVFDSGVGGLSVLAHIHDHLPDERLIYVADSAFMPYGCKSDQMVEARCMAIADFFIKFRQLKAHILGIPHDDIEVNAITNGGNSCIDRRLDGCLQRFSSYAGCGQNYEK